MSLDDTYDRMQVFAAALDRFDESLRGSLASLSACDNEVAGLWRDAFAREYALAWAPLADGLTRWCHNEGPAYRDFLASKLRALALYLDGDR